MSLLTCHIVPVNENNSRYESEEHAVMLTLEDGEEAAHEIGIAVVEALHRAQNSIGINNFSHLDITVYE